MYGFCTFLCARSPLKNCTLDGNATPTLSKNTDHMWSNNSHRPLVLNLRGRAIFDMWRKALGVGYFSFFLYTRFCICLCVWGCITANSMTP